MREQPSYAATAPGNYLSYHDLCTVGALAPIEVSGAGSVKVNRPQRAPFQLERKRRATVDLLHLVVRLSA